MIDYTDDVKGVIVGDGWYNWQLFYDGRPQSQRMPADTEQLAEDAGKALFEQIKSECGHVFRFIYPLNSWEVRIWTPT
jgi:hypothetical protein